MLGKPDAPSPTLRPGGPRPPLNYTHSAREYHSPARSRLAHAGGPGVPFPPRTRQLCCALAYSPIGSSPPMEGFGPVVTIVPIPRRSDRCSRSGMITGTLPESSDTIDCGFYSRSGIFIHETSAPLRGNSSLDCQLGSAGWPTLLMKAPRP